MSDTCITLVYIEGEKNSLQTVADRINTSGGLKSEIFASVGFTEEDLEYCNCNKFEVVEKDGRYFLHTEFWIDEWESSKEDWQKVIFPPEVFYELHTWNGNDDWTNDSNGEFFNENEVVIFVNGQPDELAGGFDTEADAVQFVKEYCPDIPKELMTIDDINDYYTDNHLDVFWYYGHTMVNNTCSPATAKAIECLIQAIKNQ